MFDDMLSGDAIPEGNYNRLRLLHVGVKHVLLFKIMRHGVLRQKRRLEPDFSADPFAFDMRSIGRMVASSSAPELRPEVRALNLIELIDLAPGSVADSARDIDF